jgi:hypothetical protein
MQLRLKNTTPELSRKFVDSLIRQLGLVKAKETNIGTFFFKKKINLCIIVGIEGLCKNILIN